jgi:hypothetical protein
MLDAFSRMEGRQIGDPARAAQAILKLADDPAPPVQLLLGSDAHRRFNQRLEAMKAEMSAWEQITLGTDYPEGS